MNRPRLWVWWVWGAMAVVGVVVAMTPGKIAERYGKMGATEHGLAFAALSLVGAAASGPRRWHWVAAGTMALGVGVEYAQGMVPGRGFEWADIRANAAGVVLGLIAAGAVRMVHWWLRKG